MAIAPTVSITMTLRDMANLVGISETFIVTTAGYITASTNYTSSLSNTDNFKYVLFGGTLTTGDRYPGLFTGMDAASVQVATGTGIAATDTITITVPSGKRRHYVFTQLFNRLRQAHLPLLFAPAGSTSPGQTVTWTA